MKEEKGEGCTTRKEESRALCIKLEGKEETGRRAVFVLRSSLCLFTFQGKLVTEGGTRLLLAAGKGDQKSKKK